jgi:hypothetical protein
MDSSREAESKVEAPVNLWTDHYFYAALCIIGIFGFLWMIGFARKSVKRGGVKDLREAYDRADEAGKIMLANQILNGRYHGHLRDGEHYHLVWRVNKYPAWRNKDGIEVVVDDVGPHALWVYENQDPDLGVSCRRVE